MSSNTVQTQENFSCSKRLESITTNEIDTFFILSALGSTFLFKEYYQRILGLALAKSFSEPAQRAERGNWTENERSRFLGRERERTVMF